MDNFGGTAISFIPYICKEGSLIDPGRIPFAKSGINPPLEIINLRPGNISFFKQHNKIKELPCENPNNPSYFILLEFHFS